MCCALQANGFFASVCSLHCSCWSGGGGGGYDGSGGIEQRANVVHIIFITLCPSFDGTFFSIHRISVTSCIFAACIKINFKIVPIISILSISNGLFFNTQKHIDIHGVCVCVRCLRLHIRHIALSFLSASQICHPSAVNWLGCADPHLSAKQAQKMAINIITRKWALINHNSKVYTSFAAGELPRAHAAHYRNKTSALGFVFDWNVQHEVIIYWHRYSLPISMHLSWVESSFICDDPHVSQ